jgi:diaminohydroxyphosphoribosylaminopyrimidine deaminase/5-amino-6-(5-phosphoribosylamino)uracil reductase
VVIDSRLRLPAASQLVGTIADAPLLVVHGASAEARARQRLEAAGCECLALPIVDDRVSIGPLLDEFGRRRWTNVLLEGGASVLGSFFEAEAIDEVWVFLAAKLAGGAAAKSALGGRGVERMAQAVALRTYTLDRIGDDLLIRGRLTMPPACPNGASSG